MIRRLGHLRQGVLSLMDIGCGLIFPPRCACCLKEIDGDHANCRLCEECLDHLSPAVWQGCLRCGAKIGRDASPTDRCLLCRDMPPKFDATIVLGSYHEGLREVIHRMKRASHEPLSMVMGRLMSERRRDRLLEQRPDVVVPVPMFWTRRLRRGVNSPEVLARCLAKPLGVPMRCDVLVRHVNTLPQADLPPSRRFQNVRGAFRVRSPEAIKNARVLLVDDVLTTGATCNEAAKTLKNAGASVVIVAVIARAG